MNICVFSDLNTPEFKSKLFSIEILFSLLEYFSSFPQTSKSFIIKIKDSLCELLLKNCICQEKQVFLLSFRTFLVLMQSYKEFLKPQIVLFIEQIFLKLLSSKNSSFPHRQASLQVKIHCKIKIYLKS